MPFPVFGGTYARGTTENLLGRLPEMPVQESNDVPWSAIVEEVCSGECVGNFVCPFLLICRCSIHGMQDVVASRLSNLALASTESNLPVPVPVKYTRLWEKDVRRYRSDDAVLEIQESIARNGLLSFPVGIASRKHWMIEIIAGITRYHAVIRLGWEKIPVRVLQVWASDTNLLIQAFQENILRREMTWMEQAIAVRTIWEDMGRPFGARSLARLLGKSPAWVVRRLSAKEVLENQAESPRGQHNTNGFRLRVFGREGAGIGIMLLLIAFVSVLAWKR